MRIAIVNWSSRKVGGAETYLETIIPELLSRGHEVASWSEMDQPVERARINVPTRASAWCISEMGESHALTVLQNWNPTLIYTHGLLNQNLENKLLKIAPAIFYAHNYYGSCISGTKTFKWPTAMPCDRKFGMTCFAYYYTRRCGGLNPATMIKDYKLQSKRLKLLGKYRAILTNSEHMRSEYRKYGLEAHSVPLPVEQVSAPVEKIASPYWRLLYLGRMDLLKGGLVLLDSLAAVSASTSKPIHVVFAGDGPERKAWEKRAARMLDTMPKLKIEFVGWVNREQRESLWANTDLLVVPSLWPEPFGLIGPEAGLHGIPAVAFNVGGISEWLVDGLNGCLAVADPPRSSSLAEAILRCLQNPDFSTKLRQGAINQAQRFNMERHIDELMKVSSDVISPVSRLSLELKESALDALS